MNTKQPTALDGAQNVFTRMKHAHDKGKGVRITADELDSLSLTILGEIWSEVDPRTSEGIGRICPACDGKGCDYFDVEEREKCVNGKIQSAQHGSHPPDVPVGWTDWLRIQGGVHGKAYYYLEMGQQYDTR